jgi:hypothetical protein
MYLDIASPKGTCLRLKEKGRGRERGANHDAGATKALSLTTDANCSSLSYFGQPDVQTGLPLSYAVGGRQSNPGCVNASCSSRSTVAFATSPGKQTVSFTNLVCAHLLW